MCLDWELNQDDFGMNYTLQPLHHVAVALNEQERLKYKAH